MDDIHVWHPHTRAAVPARGTRPGLPPLAHGLASATALVAVAAALVLLLAGCGGGDGAAPPEPPPVVGRDGRGPAGTLSAAAPGELASWARDRLARQESDALAPRLAPALPAAPGATGAAVSSTRLQEAGVDEPDVLKTDGRLIVTQTLRRSASGHIGPALQLHARAEDGSLAEGARWESPQPGPLSASVMPRGLLLAADGRSLVALSERSEPVSLPVEPAAACAGCAQALLVPPPTAMQQRTEVRRFDTPDLARLEPGDSLAIDGRLVDARRIGDTLVLVTRHAPVLALPSDPLARTAAIAGLSDTQLLPRRWGADGRATPLLQPGDCWLQNGLTGTGLELTVVTLLDLRSPTLATSSRCLPGGTDAVYLTPRHLWLASTRWQPEAGLSTDVHQFAVDEAAQALQYRGSATVAGDLGWVEAHRSYRLSEHEGHLRVLSFTGSFDATAGVSPARLTVLKLREAASGSGTLQTVATLPNERRPGAIGKPGEQLYGVAFAGGRGYAVTYRRIDPLYVLDLANPEDPRVTGELELPGFSEVLQPLPGGLLLGVGQDEAEGVAVVLFDVADAASPRVLDRHTVGGRGAMHGLSDSRHAMALRLDGDAGRIALPLRTGWGPAPTYAPGVRGLQTLELDLAARQLRPRALVGAAVDADDDWFTALGSDRAALIGDDLYHLRAGRLARHAW